MILQQLASQSCSRDNSALSVVLFTLKAGGGVARGFITKGREFGILSWGGGGGGGLIMSREVTVFSHYKPHMTRVLGYISIIIPSLQRSNREHVQCETHRKTSPVIISLSLEN